MPTDNNSVMVNTLLFFKISDAADSVVERAKQMLEFVQETKSE